MFKVLFLLGIFGVSRGIGVDGRGAGFIYNRNWGLKIELFLFCFLLSFLVIFRYGFLVGRKKGIRVLLGKWRILGIGGFFCEVIKEEVV